MAYKGRVRPTIALTSADIAADAVGSSEIAAGAVDTAEIATDAVTANEIAAGAVAASEIAATFDISSKTVTLPAASVTAHVTAFNDDLIQNNIAVLAFKMAISESLTKFGMVDQVIDNFADASGVDSGASSLYTKTSNYYSGLGLAQKITNATAIGTMTQSPGALANAFDGDNTKYTYSDGAYKDPTTGCWLGQDWGSGVTKTPNRYKIWGPEVYPLPGGGLSGGTPSNGDMKLEGSANNSSWTQLHLQVLDSTINTNGVNASYDISSGITTSTAYRYHRIWFEGDGNGGVVAELEFWDSNGVGDMVLVSTTTTAEATATTADLVFLLEDGAGTNSITASGDVRAYVSRNGNANWSSALTLVDEGDLDSTRRIITARNIDISGLTGTTAMRWKITAHSQSAAKEARIHAVSLGWS